MDSVKKKAQNSNQALEVKSQVVKNISKSGELAVKKSKFNLKTVSLDDAKLSQYLKDANEGKLKPSPAIPEYLGERYMTACIGNEEFEAYWGGPDNVSEGSVIELSKPKAKSWIRLKTPRGEKGFAKDQQFYVGY